MVTPYPAGTFTLQEAPSSLGALTNGASAATGFRSATQLDPVAAKTKPGSKKVLDQAVGWMRLLGGH